ncbi:dispanin subfamily A member 2b-like [Hyperolius riggenbachi]|uniref:dispanin subfamily A member 2b-like n=1 Tax=Hyperolius riggenbachi TaxID=752182 RepID=UPI0035A3261A
MENFSNEVHPPPAYGNQGYEQVNQDYKKYSSPQSTVVTIMPEGPPVRDHIIWSIFNAIYLNFCCLGVIALVYSVKSRDSKQLGDRNRATGYGSTARSLNIAATVLSVLVFIVVIIIYAIQISKIIEMLQNKQSGGQSDYPNMYGK